jgi:peroxiredoxin (alkyl hydroperoxide reductase subunit C)
LAIGTNLAVRAAGRKRRIAAMMSSPDDRSARGGRAVRAPAAAGGSGDDSPDRPRYINRFGEEGPMTVKVGDTIPAAKLMQATAEGPKEISTDELFKGKTVVLFGVPGAFTPTCSAKHLPGFVQNFDALKAKGADVVACMAVNDAFVMGAWGKDQGVGDKVVMLADGSADFTKKLGLELDLTARGLGVRAQRFALVAKDGKVTHVAVEAPGAFEVSKAESVLAAL